MITMTTSSSSKVKPVVSIDLYGNLMPTSVNSLFVCRRG